MNQEAVLSALARAGGRWIKRAELATLLGRPHPRLHERDLAALAALEADGRIDVQRIKDARPAGYIVLYRAKQGA